MFSIIHYTLITAFRDLLFLGLFIMVVIATMISSFLGGTAISEQEQMQLVYMAGSNRMIIIFGLILFVCFHVKRLFDSKEIEVILSKPISRTKFIFSYWFSFTLLSAFLTVPVIFLIGTVFHPNMFGLFYWGSSLILEGAIVVAFAFLASLIMRSAIAATLSTFCFYFLARMMGFMLASYRDQALSLPDFSQYKNVLFWLNHVVLKFVSMIVPRLDMYAKSNWLVYGMEKSYDYWLFPAQSAVFIPLMLLVAIYDFRNKEF